MAVKLADELPMGMTIILRTFGPEHSELVQESWDSFMSAHMAQMIATPEARKNIEFLMATAYVGGYASGVVGALRLENKP